MKHLKKIAAVAAITTLALTGCSNNAYQERVDLQKQSAKTTSLELDNLKEKRDREDDPDAIRYLYVMSFGQVIGYYVTQGKVSSNGSQIAPEAEIVRPWTGADGFVMDSSQDDGSYGDGDPGIFFFTTDGVMVVTSLDYIQSDEPLPIDVPRFGGAKK